jgi:hypothetical protein
MKVNQGIVITYSLHFGLEAFQMDQDRDLSSVKHTVLNIYRGFESFDAEKLDSNFDHSLTSLPSGLIGMRNS